MKTNGAGSLWRIVCLLLCSTVSVWAAAPEPEPAIELGEDFSLDKPVQLVMPCATWSEVTANRDQIVADEANGTNSLKYRNMESTAGGNKPTKTFEGTVKFVGALGVLAIISDDGCTVSVKVHGEAPAKYVPYIKKYGKPQKLDANAFATVPFVFQRDILYDVKVEYSQVYYAPQPGKPDIDGATLYACLLSVEFKARDLDSLNAGFDPPMAGDIHVPVDDNGNVLASEAKKDEDAWEAWTSVAKTGPYATNQKTKLVVASDSIASQLELAVADDSTQWIDLQEKGKALTSKETLLTITGKDDGSQFVRPATIEVRCRGTSIVVAKLRVKVLNPYTVHTTFYGATDSQSARSGFDPEPQIDTPVAGQGANAAEADTRFAAPTAVTIGLAQAPSAAVHKDVRFDLRPAGAPWRIGDPGDSTGRGDCQMMDVKNDEEGALAAFRTLESAGQFPGKIRVVYVPWINNDVFALADWGFSNLVFVAVNKWIRVDQGPRGITIQSDELLEEVATGATSRMERVVAHEIGHVLGLSKRTDFETPQLPDDTNGERNSAERIGHDGGKFPDRTVGLMRSGFVGAPGKWLRHEDWEAANLRARKLNNP